MKKLAIFRDYEMDESGVTAVWAWECPEKDCFEKGHYGGASLYWEAAVRGANNHIGFHAGLRRESRG